MGLHSKVQLLLANRVIDRVTNTLAYCGTEVIIVLKNFVIQGLCSQSQHFIILVTYEWNQKARVFFTGKPT
jgi:hypothetical protein